MVQELTSGNFDQVVLDSKVPVVVDFWAEWCGPCKTIAPVLDVIDDEQAGKVVIGKLNVDTYPDIAQRYGVQSIPFVARFEGGEIVKHVVGAMPKKQLTKALGL